MIEITEPHLHIAADTHPGVTGKENEDRYGVTSFHIGPRQQTPSVLAVLCDGIGGHRAGEVAAEMGVSIITKDIAASDAKKPLKTMQEAIFRASDAIYEASQSDQGRGGMGATCAVAWVIGDALYTTNLGDSRIYLLREGHIVQLTTDHTWVQEALDAQIITDADREDHPNAHVIRRYLGSKAEPKLDFRMWLFEGETEADALNNQGLQLLPGDILLLCSDGLTDLVTDEEIRAVIQGTPLAQIPTVLINMANSRGGHDNITLVLMEMPPVPRVKVGGLRKRRWLIGCVAVLAILSVVITAVFFGLRWWGGTLDALETAQPALTAPLQVETPETMFTQTLSPTDSPSTEATVSMGAPQPSITPWPTHTLAP